MASRTCLVVVAACASSAQPAPPIMVPAPAPHVVAVDLTVEEPGPPASEVLPCPRLAQPPHVKLALGHYVDDDRGIGLTIDRTTRTASSIPPVKARFDGSSEVLVLEGERGARGRIDYARADRRLAMQIFDDGRVVIFVFDPKTTHRSGPIDVVRDCDAEPL